MKVVLLNVFSDEREISYETTLDGIVRENELRMSYKDKANIGCILAGLRPIIATCDPLVGTRG